MGDRLLALMRAAGATTDAQATLDLKRWLTEILRDYVEAQQYLDGFVPAVADGVELSLKQRIQLLALLTGTKVARKGFG